MTNKSGHTVTGGLGDKGADICADVEVDLAEAFTGTKVQLRVPTRVACEACNGTGSENRERGSETCSVCGGAGKVQRERALQVQVPAGVEDGSRIRLPGEGEAGGPGAAQGDLYLRVGIRPHPIFQRDGANIFCRVPLRMAQAALGAEVEVPAIDASKARVKIPPGTQAGDQFRLRGKGFSVLRSAARGDMYIQVTVETPLNLTRRQRELLLEEFEGKVNAGSSPEHEAFFAKVRDIFEGPGR
jgi:molecular chaperone DnaJ